jgi:hypothetical protein
MFPTRALDPIRVFYRPRRAKEKKELPLLQRAIADPMIALSY